VEKEKKKKEKRREPARKSRKTKFRRKDSGGGSPNKTGAWLRGIRENPGREKEHRVGSLFLKGKEASEAKKGKSGQPP